MDAVADEFVADLVAALRAGQPVSDHDFDRLLEPQSRALSRIHWSPVKVCARAVELLKPGPHTRVLDVGSGAGKFCVLGSLLTEASFTGVERREQLVGEANALAERTCAPLTDFVLGDAFALDWSAFDALYFYNPFGELEVTELGRIDGQLDADRAELAYRRDETARRLSKMPVGTRVVLFHGAGTDMPPGYSLLSREGRDEGPLELWMQTKGVFARNARPH